MSISSVYPLLGYFATHQPVSMFLSEAKTIRLLPLFVIRVVRFMGSIKYVGVMYKQVLHVGVI